ncbi:DegT/DnrJ/EryC1/StrS aminotransferase family protein [Pedobacter sp. UBA4863]|uniref:DegT/DnrJ/EryC1/StrS family aminotransferase n=1 Tax=Pedobacter sp. UBA4863 TaxID=1947060 RepID=UPI0025F7168C|nr:DegT/DnrJ/EryC1/StrS family aminotransferase [Pedobacter sp. UBA4863]
MVDLKSQYKNIKSEIDIAVQSVLDSTAFINGSQVRSFEEKLANYLAVNDVVSCGNGTDALQIALMALNLQPGDEVIVPAFTYVATAEVIALLKLKPVMTEVCPATFNITAELIEKAITAKTKAIVPVHLYGQCADMEPILNLAKKHSLYVIEDAAQAIGADYTFSNRVVKKAGTMGDIGCTSFFPSKNLGCYGDGGALYTNNAALAKKVRMIANHGQEKKYHHKVVGCNSRLDTLQAAILEIKLKYLENYTQARIQVANAYDNAFKEIEDLIIPKRSDNASHVFNQYTVKLQVSSKRDALKQFLQEKAIPSMVYYPISLHLQDAFKTATFGIGDFPVTQNLCASVLSLPIHTEMQESQLNYIIDAVKLFFKV